MFRSVDWTHDMIIVKWHLFIWHERKLCALTNTPPVQSTQTGERRSTLFHANCSGAQVYVLHPGQFTFAPSCRRRSFLHVLQYTERKERYCEKFFVYLMMTNVMMKTCLNQKIAKISNLIQAMKNSACPKAKVMRRPNFSERRICPDIFRMFRSVDWTHDMIIVKWHIFIWNERKLCALTNAPTVQSTQTGQWLSTLFHANCSAAQVYVLHPGQFTFATSCRQRSFLQVLQSTERRERYCEKFLLYLMMTNVMMKTCLNQKIIKISNLIQAMKNSVCPTPNVPRRLIFSESWIFRSFGIVDSTHDMTIVKWHLLNFSKAEFVRIFTECSEVWIEHTTDNREWHLFIWHERKLCALTNAPPVQSTPTGQWLSTLFHANCSVAQVYVLYPRQFIFAPSCRRRPFLQVLQFTEHSEGYFEKFFVYLMMTNVMVKTCLNQKFIKKFEFDSGKEE